MAGPAWGSESGEKGLDSGDVLETEWGHKRKNKGGKGVLTVLGGRGTWRSKVGGQVPSSRSPLCFLPIGNKDSPSSQLLTHHP